jgi:hypothetical protein
MMKYADILIGTDLDGKFTLDATWVRNGTVQTN